MGESKVKDKVRNKDAIARTYRKKRLVYTVSAPGRLRGKSGEGEFILYSILQKHLFSEHQS